MRTVTVNVDVEVDLADIDDDDLIKEVDRRNLKGAAAVVDHGEAMQKMFMAMSTGNEAQALDLLRGYLCDCLGRCLP